MASREAADCGRKMCTCCREERIRASMSAARVGFMGSGASDAVAWMCCWM